jgi:hypothetical protein
LSATGASSFLTTRFVADMWLILSDAYLKKNFGHFIALDAIDGLLALQLSCSDGFQIALTSPGQSHPWSLNS